MNDTINTEVEKDLEIDAEDVSEDLDTNTDAEEDSELDFEYDENGDIIIPDEDDDADAEDASEDDTDEDDADADEEQDETSEEDAEEAPAEQEVVEPASTQQDDKDRENAALRRRLSALESQTKDTLAKLGVDNGDIMAGLVKLAAEADEITPEEYLRRKAEQDRNAEAVRTLQAIEFEKKMKADLAEVHAAFPETRKYDSVTKFPNFAKFGQFRDAKLSPKEAYIAAHPDAVRESVATATKRQSLNETKSHLKPVVSKQSKDNSITITKKEMAEYRELFPNMSDKEIMSLYRQAKKK